jgi:transcriptional regulator GlxA family with amidase domain
MLREEDLSISEIAYRTGFTSPSYFTKCFRQTFNYAPSDAAKYASKTR